MNAASVVRYADDLLRSVTRSFYEDDVCIVTELMLETPLVEFGHDAGYVRIIDGAAVVAASGMAAWRARRIINRLAYDGFLDRVGQSETWRMDRESVVTRIGRSIRAMIAMRNADVHRAATENNCPKCGTIAQVISDEAGENILCFMCMTPTTGFDDTGAAAWHSWMRGNVVRYHSLACGNTIVQTEFDSSDEYDEDVWEDA